MGPSIPQIIRVLRGQGDQWDNIRVGARGVTASFSLNGIGLVPEEDTPDLYQENEELKVILNILFISLFYTFVFQEEIQKLAAQIEYMKIVQMEINNRHVRPKTGGYFTTQLNAPTVVHSPLLYTKSVCLLNKVQAEEL